MRIVGTVLLLLLYSVLLSGIRVLESETLELLHDLIDASWVVTRRARRDRVRREASTAHVGPLAQRCRGQITTRHRCATTGRLLADGELLSHAVVRGIGSTASKTSLTA